MLDFERRFATEEMCRDHLFCARYPKGFNIRIVDIGNFGGRDASLCIAKAVGIKYHYELEQ